MNSLKMSWNDRFALIDHFKPTDAQAVAAFGLTQDELETARDLRSAGTFNATSGMDMTQYSTLFTSVNVAPPVAKKPSAVVSTTSSAASSSVKPAAKQSTATSHSKPETATKKSKEPQKRGRKGDRITTALAAVPTTQVSAEQFSKDHGVSIAVLRQSKRFLEKMDPAQQELIGKINVRQDKATKTLMIWREVTKGE